MKRIRSSILTILLAAVMLAGCAAPTGQFRGTIKDNVYTSESAELTFAAPDSWEYYTDAQCSSYYWSYPDTPVDMYTSDAVTGSKVMIAYEDLAKTGKTDCDEEAYFDLMKQERIKDNPDLKFGDYTETKIGKNTFMEMVITSTDYGSAYYYARREGNCMICICASVKDGDIDSVMANFS